MDAGMELQRRLEALLPGLEDEIGRVLGEYRVTRREGPQEALEAAVRRFLDAKAVDGLAGKTLKGYREALGAFAGAVDRPPAEISAADLRAYIAGLSARGLKEGTVRTYGNVLRSFFSWLELEEEIPRSPMRRIRARRLDRTASRQPLSAQELERLRDGCRDARERALVEFLVSSGCRLGELVAIRRDQIDWQRRSVQVLGKGGKSRTVFFSVRAAMDLEAYLAGRPGEALFTAARAPHGPMTASGVQKILGRVGQRAGLRRSVHPHVLRHTFATNALRGGMDLAVIQQLLGHSDPKTTMIYAHLQPEAVRAAYEKYMS